MMRTRRLVLFAFTLVGTGVVTMTLFAIGLTRTLEDGARELVDNTLTSVRLLGQLQNEVAKQHNLVDDHVASSDAAQSASVEDSLAKLEVAMEGTMRAYDPWANEPLERASWNTARGHLMSLREQVSRVIALSRGNRDDEARRVMTDVESLFDVVERDFDHLISINDASASARLAQVRMIQLRLVLALLGLGIAALIGTLFVGQWAARHVARGEEEAALKAKNLEERNRELDAFAGRVAHDLRGSLSTITLPAARLTAAAPGEKRSAELLGRGVQRMTSLVDDLLSLARIDAQAPGDCDPATIAAEVREDFATRFEGQGGALEIAVDRAKVSCGPGLFRQALTNLTENAVKYRRPEVAPSVRIVGAVVSGGYELRVSDNGVGMSADEADHIFDPFYRSPRTQGLPGTGLGLSIVKRIVEVSGGTIAVRTRLGVGSTFVVLLPAVQAAAP